MFMEATYHNCPRDKYVNMQVNDISEIVATTEDMVLGITTTTGEEQSSLGFSL